MYSAVDPTNFKIHAGESDSSTNHSVSSMLKRMSGKSWYDVIAYLATGGIYAAHSNGHLGIGQQAKFFGCLQTIYI